MIKGVNQFLNVTLIKWGVREGEVDEWTREGAHFNYKVSRAQSIN
jgi:hypothetical protein